MKKAVAAEVSLFALALATAASADSVNATIDAPPGAPIVSVSGGVGTTPQPLGGSSSGPVASGKTSWSPVRIEANTNAQPVLFTWVSDVLQQKASGHQLLVTSYDSAGNAKQTTKYSSPQITEVVLPILSRTDKSAASFAVELTIQGATVTTATGKAPESRIGPTWTHANFDASLTAMPAAIGVSALQFSLPVAPGSGLATGKPRLSAFHMVFEGSQLKPLQSWLAQGKATPMSIAGGSSGGFAAKEARIVYRALAKDRSIDLFTVSLKTCGPVAVTQTGANADVEIACGDYTFAASGP